MGTRFVPVPDWETAAALVSEGLLWFTKSDGTPILLPKECRPADGPGYWCYSRLDLYKVRIED